MKRLMFTMLLCTLLTIPYLTVHADESQNRIGAFVKHVSIEKKPTHFEVTMDFSDGESHFNMGSEYGRALHAAVPDIESLMDSYLSEYITLYAGYEQKSPEDLFEEYLRRIEDIKPNIPIEYQQELDGISVTFEGTENKLGDGKMSRNKLYLLNLITDVTRPTACSAFSVFGSRSASGGSIAARNLDWGDMSQNQLAKVNAVTTIKDGKKSVCLIGYLGYIGALSAINDNHVFAAVLDSPTGAEYDSLNRRSYVMDLRWALENCATLDAVANYMIDPEKKYTFNHNIFLVDAVVSRVVENNISGPGNNIHRAVRSWDSELNPGVEWGLRNSIGVVNSFVLSGNTDYHTNDESNYGRWATIIREARARGGKIDRREIREIISYHKYALGTIWDPGDLFNPITMQSMIVEPKDFDLRIAFKPSNGIWSDPPRYEKIKIWFGHRYFQNED